MDQYTYLAKLVRVIDGDTIDIRVNLGFGICYDTRVRLIGVDTPEIYGKNASEEGKEVKAFVEERLTDKVLAIQTYKDRTGKYGRYLAIVFYQDGDQYTSLNKELLDLGLAEPYPPKE